MKKISLVLLIAMLLGFVFISCESDFNENEGQYEQKFSEIDPDDDGKVVPTDPDDDGEG